MRFRVLSRYNGFNRHHMGRRLQATVSVLGSNEVIMRYSQELGCQVFHRIAVVAVIWLTGLVGTDHSGVYGAGPSTSNTVLADQKLVEGQQAYERGDFQMAIEHWKQSESLYDRVGLIDGRIDAIKNQSTALCELGRYRMAGRQLNQALQLAHDAGDLTRIIGLYDDLGAVLTLAQDLGSARTNLDKSLALVSDGGDRQAEISVLNNLGNLHVAQARHDEALATYLRSADLARQEGDDLLLARALSNAARSAIAVDDQTRATTLCRQVLTVTARLDPTHDQAVLFITTGHLYEGMMHRFVAHQDQNLRSAYEAFSRGLDRAQDLSDQRVMSYALEGLARIYDTQGRTDEALRVARQAVMLAEQSRLTASLYRLQWLSGRLLNAKGKKEEAITAYGHAAEALGSIQQAMTVGLGNRHPTSSFREQVGPLFYEFADLLLQQAAVTTDPDRAQKIMRQSVEVLERLKSAELVDYFQDQCIGQLRAQSIPIEQIASDTAAVYFLPLSDRTEILLIHRDEISRFSSPVARDQLVQEVRRFRYELEDLSTLRHTRHAQRLYQWLIDPIETELRSRDIQTLVFVPDGALRLIPMAALHDGDQYLAQRYAAAITPGLTLTDPKPIEPGTVRMLAAGLTASDHGESLPLEYVQEEIERVTQYFEATLLVDEAFNYQRFESEIRQNPYTAVHIASHGQFGDSPSETFIVAYDSKFTLTDLEQMIRPTRFRDQPIELLALSACQTAAGDDRAALGLAGVALKAGARSVVATLWSVHDRAAAVLMTEFYKQIRDHPGLSKARALQRAQLVLLDSPLHRDPYFWSPFLVIGNWQ